MPLSAGQTFAGYTVVRPLGSGGMGEVYLVQHPRLPRRDALKLLASDISADHVFRERFLREADLASTLWHPHIVGVLDRGECDGQLWISMDFVDGEDVGSLKARRYPTGMPPDLVAEIVTAIASALDHAHRQGFLHRDVKPANILLAGTDGDQGRRILLTDFGIARPVDDQTGLTATNMTIGTVAYAAPEQLMGENVDGRADQYSLAITAYELLAGAPPFRDSNPAVVIGRHLSAAPPALAISRPELAGLDPVLATALAKDPNGRFASCGDFARALAARVSQDSASATMAAPAPPPPAQGPDVPRSPGWYHDPGGAPRYWDGRGWQLPPAPPTAPAGSRPASQLTLLVVLGLVVVLALIGSAVLWWGRRGGESAPTAAPATVSATVPSAAQSSPRTTTTPWGGPATSTATPAPQQGPWRGVIVGTCDEGGTCGVKQRTAPYTAAPRLYPDDLMDGMVVTVVCQTTGDTRSSQGRGSSYVWYRLDNGAYVNLVYLDVTGSGIPTC